ncbi:MAG: hypothetical protein KA941_03215 [Flavobacteriales bacterium]|nr:hypothetical protein [Flavobacteriales bacterium]
MAKKKSAAKGSANKRSAAKPKSVKKAAPAKKKAVKKAPAKKKAVVKSKKAAKPIVKKVVPKGKRTAAPAKKVVKKAVVAKKVMAKKAPVKAAPKAIAKKPSIVAKKVLAPVKEVASKPAPPLPVTKAAPAPSKQPATKAPERAAATSPKTAAPKPVVIPPKPVEKKPLKERVTMEFEVRSAPNVLFDLISTPSGFSEWYCDDVDVRGDQYTFKWGNDEEAATMIGRKAPEVIRFHRNDDTDEASFYEFRIRIDAMTNEVALIVTDHAWPNEVDETRSLWESQVASLLRVLGA